MLWNHVLLHIPIIWCTIGWMPYTYSISLSLSLSLFISDSYGRMNFVVLQIHNSMIFVFASSMNRNIKFKFYRLCISFSSLEFRRFHWLIDKFGVCIFSSPFFRLKFLLFYSLNDVCAANCLSHYSGNWNRVITHFLRFLHNFSFHLCMDARFQFGSFHWSCFFSVSFYALSLQSLSLNYSILFNLLSAHET